MGYCDSTCCGYWWQDEDELYPSCHYDDPWPAPCEYDEEDNYFDD